MPDLRCLETVRNPCELNRLLITIREIAGGQNRSLKSRLQYILREQSYQAGPILFNDLLDLAFHFRLIHIHEDSVSITPTGEKFLNDNPNDDYTLTEAQKHLLIYSILFGRTPISKQFEFILGEFAFNIRNDRYEGVNLASSGRLSALGLRLFCSAIGFLNEAENGTRFFDPLYNTEIARRIRIFRHPEWDGQEPSEEILALSKHAEELIYTEEKARLTTCGYPELSRRVQLVSEYNSAAGYDILSFEGESSRPEIPDRFIEVKSSVYEKMRFILTRQERKKAEELRSQYHIIFIGNHDYGKNLHECRVEILTDPVEYIFDRDRFIIDAPKLQIIEKGLEGYEISENE